MGWNKKARYYATRIAQTEQQRSINLARAKEYIDDKEIAFVKYRMSSKHPMTDICDYYANLDIGYGKGIVPKEQMITLPLHPHCMCRYDPYYLPAKRKKPTPWLEKQSETVQRQVLGGYAQWKRWMEGAPVESVFNMMRPNYPIRRYVEVLGIKAPKKMEANGIKAAATALGAVGYNGGMEILTKKNITNAEREAISGWVDYKTSQQIRKYYYGFSIEERYKKMAIILKSMLKKYDSGLDKTKPIYRGLRFKDKTEFQKFLTNFIDAHATKNSIEIDLAPASFSRSEKVAYEEFALAHKDSFYSLVFKLVNRGDGELYIEDFAGQFAYQEEVIIRSHESKYKVIDIQESKEYNKTYEVVIEEV